MSLLVWPLTLLSLIFMYPWARWLLHRAEGRAMLPTYNPLLSVLTTVGLSIGTLSLVMLWMGLLGIRLDWRLAALVCLVIGASGLFAKDKPSLLHDTPAYAAPPEPLQKLARAAWIIITVLCGLILFNAVYWPFGIDDALVIYASFGKSIATTGWLPFGKLYEAYPMLIPLDYAFVFQSSGWTNEYLAALYPALLSIGVVGVAYQLGRELINRAAGLIAALLIVLCPMFTHWASTGYVDLPAGFFYGMTVLFLARSGRTHTWADALLAGLMAGFAAWTKNSTLLIVPCIALWVVYRWWLVKVARIDRRQRLFKTQHVLLIAIGFVAVAGAWYARNLLMAGLLVPPTAWADKAARTLPNLFPYLVDSRYGVIGPLFTAGGIYIIWQCWQTRGRDPLPMLLAIFTLPFGAVWWLIVSYDDRFLLVLTPLVAVMAALVVQEVWRRVPQRFIWLAYAIPMIVLLALPAASTALDYKFDLLFHPFMSDAAKHHLRLGDRYEMALYLRTLPTGSRVLTQDLLLPFHADGVQVQTDVWPDAAQFAAHPYDYWVLSPGAVLPEWFGQTEPIHKQGDYRLYKVMR
ncbi:MAG: glycosyltransferase family 39 protein [Chloroflexota bacterium]